MSKDWPVHYIPDMADIEAALEARGFAIEPNNGWVYPLCPVAPPHPASPWDDCGGVEPDPDRRYDEARGRNAE